jgi:hypothetical protein
MGTLPDWSQAKRIGLDIETHDPQLRKLGIGVRRGGKVVGVSFAIEDGPKFYLPFGHLGGDNLDGLNNLGINGAVYGTITRALYPTHAPFIDTAGGARNISVPVLDNAWNVFRTTVDPLPGTWFGVTSVAQITALRALVVGAGVFENVATNSIKTLGNDAVEYNGIPIFGMVNFPASIIDFYRAESLAWECLRGAANPIYIDPEPEKTDDTFKWNAYLHAQICLDNPRRSCFSINQLV